MSVEIPGSRDGSMGLWEVTEEVMGQAERSQNEESVPSYAHISHRALKDIPKEFTNQYNCKVRALAFNNNDKVILISYSLYMTYCFKLLTFKSTTLELYGGSQQLLDKKSCIPRLGIVFELFFPPRSPDSGI